MATPTVAQAQAANNCSIIMNKAGLHFQRAMCCPDKDSFMDTIKWPTVTGDGEKLVAAAACSFYLNIAINVTVMIIYSIAFEFLFVGDLIWFLIWGPLSVFWACLIVASNNKNGNLFYFIIRLIWFCYTLFVILYFGFGNTGIDGAFFFAGLVQLPALYFDAAVVKFAYNFYQSGEVDSSGAQKEPEQFSSV